MVRQSNQLSATRFAIYWWVANSIGWIIGALCSIAIGVIIIIIFFAIIGPESAAWINWVAATLPYAGIPLVSAAFGFCIGVAQEFVLKTTDRLPPWHWLWATTVGWFLVGIAGSLVSILMPDEYPIIEAAAVFVVFGFVPGYVQCFALQRVADKFYRWVFYQSGFWVVLLAPSRFFDFIPGSNPDIETMIIVLYMICWFFILQVIAGALLANLLRHPRPQRTELEAA